MRRFNCNVHCFFDNPIPGGLSIVSSNEPYILIQESTGQPGNYDQSFGETLTGIYKFYLNIKDQEEKLKKLREIILKSFKVTRKINGIHFHEMITARCCMKENILFNKGRDISVHVPCLEYRELMECGKIDPSKEEEFKEFVYQMTFWLDFE